MEYTLRRPDGTIERVEEERWGWQAVYRDGTTIQQFGDAGDFHQFREIDISKIWVLRMVKMSDRSRIVDVVISPGSKPVHFYVNQHLDVGGPNERHQRIYVFGWDDAATGGSCRLHIFPDDCIAASPDKLSISC